MKKKSNTNSEEIWKRFDEKHKQIIKKKESLKKKIEENERKDINFKPKINRDTKYYKNENNSFLKRVEIYKFVSEARKSEIRMKDNKNINHQNPQNKKKISMNEVKKNIDAQLEKKRQKDQEREEKYFKKMEEMEETEMLECTFTPRLLDTSLKMNKSLIRSKSQVNDIEKLSSVSKILDTEASKKNKLENLETSETNNTNNLYLRKQKSANKTIKWENNNIKETKEIKRDYSQSRLEEIPEQQQANLSINYDLNNNKSVGCLNLSSIGNNYMGMNISKKESEIMKELMNRKLK